MELVRPSDNARSEPRQFTYLPSKFKPGGKRARYDYSSSSYDSSNVGSDELPAVIKHLNLENNVPVQNEISVNNVSTNNVSNISWNAQDMLTSEELMVAMHNIDSDEFRRLFMQHEKEYSPFISNVLDAPQADRRMGAFTHRGHSFA